MGRGFFYLFIFFIPIFCISLPFCADSQRDIHSKIVLNLHCYRILEVYLKGGFSSVCVCVCVCVGCFGRVSMYGGISCLHMYECNPNTLGE